MLPTVISLFLGLAASAPLVVERSEYYEVSGSSARELRTALDRMRPTDPMGERRDAVTNGDVRWKYKYTKVADGCALTSLTTTLAVVTSVPRWSNRRADSPLAEQWDRFVAAIEDHERVHRQIVLRGARTIHDRLAGLDAAPTCAQLEDSINLMGRALVDEVQAENEEYDRRTRHGATQGVVFPQPR